VNNMSGTCPENAALLAFAADALDDESGRTVREHVASCGRCAARLAEIERVTSILRNASNAPPARSPGCPEAEALAAYADGSADERVVASVEEHLASCGACLAEVADLRSLAGEEEADAPERVVRSALARLEAEGRTAVVRLTERALSVARDFARSQAAAVRAGLGAGEELRPALARGAAPSHRLAWADEGGLGFDGRIEIAAGAPSLVGRVILEGSPARGVSVSLVTCDGRRGPESVDREGRFGPWKLGGGTNSLVLSGLDVPGGSVELTVEIVTAERSRHVDREPGSPGTGDDTR